MSPLWVLPVVFALTAVGTGIVLRYAQRRLLDVPGERSSHEVPTPRGGGAAIVAVLTGAWVLAVLVGAFHTSHYWALAGSLVVAGLGFADDHGGLSAGWRLAGHVVAGVSVVVVLGAGDWSVDGLRVPEGIAAAVIVFVIAWMINLTNFMDGIDGIAAVQAITVCGGGALATWMAGGDSDVVWAAVFVAVAGAGFLVWNWPPAKIFMGDVGSGYLGFLMGALPLWAGQFDAALLGAWTILNATFVTDATVTLCRRVVRREPLFEAHRSHAYQWLATHRQHHLRVSLLVGATNVIWLLPLALLVARGSVPIWFGVAAAYIPLVALATWVQIRRYTFST